MRAVVLPEGRPWGLAGGLRGPSAVDTCPLMPENAPDSSSSEMSEMAGSSLPAGGAGAPGFLSNPLLSSQRPICTGFPPASGDFASDKIDQMHSGQAWGLANGHVQGLLQPRCLSSLPGSALSCRLHELNGKQVLHRQASVNAWGVRPFDRSSRAPWDPIPRRIVRTKSDIPEKASLCTLSRVETRRPRRC